MIVDLIICVGAGIGVFLVLDFLGHATGDYAALESQQEQQ